MLTLNDAKSLIKDMKVHEHICLIYEDEKEWESTIIPFLVEGFKRDEKCIYITDRHNSETIKELLIERGFDPEKLKGQFRILSEDEAYTRGGTFDPDAMIKLLEEETEKALAEGYSALRATGEMTWILKGKPGSEKLIEYEAKLNRFFPKAKCLAICQYEKSAFEPEILKGVIMTHPILLWNGEIYRNFYYIPPEILLEGDHASAEVENWLRNIKREKDFIESIEMFTGLFKSFIDNVPAMVSVKDSNLKYFFVNNRFCRFAGKKESEIIGKTVHEVFDEETATILEKLGEIPLKGEDISLERKIRGRYYHIRKFPVEIPIGKRGIASIILDITESKKFEEKLRKLTKSFINIVENSPESIFIVNKNGKVYYANQQALRYFGWEKSEIIGKTIGMPSKPNIIEEIQTIDANGNLKIAEIRTAKTYWEDEECTLISIRDITEIKEYEKSLKKALIEKETLLKEIHHRVKNNLQIIISLINLQAQKEDKELLKETTNRIRAIARVHEKIYQSEDLASINLKEYIKDIISELKATYKLPRIKFNIQVQDIKLTINQAIPCGLIINEALTNSMRHAFPDKEGTITVKAYKSRDSINLIMEDDGIGFPEGFKPEECETMGMRLIYTLTRQIDGEIKIKGEKGVKIELKIPIP
ncbi:MAG: two-component system, sensor histidine kinase PdtaS [Methanobacteriaceae archaeon]|nr:two-component system, sensor histidine kinase PdtaS [Methanobacteriaceae archaeon]